MNENIKNIAEIIANKEDDNDTVIILAKLKLDFSEAIPFATALDKAGYRKERETITFYKDPNIKDWAESEYAWCERPCDSNMSMRAIDKKGSIVGYASEHYWTWCDVKEVKKISAIEFMRHFASKQNDTVREFAQKAISRVFEGITQRFCDCYNDGFLRGYPDSELSRNFLRAFDECKDIAEKEINDLAEQYGKED